MMDAMKHLSIATVTAGILVVSMTGAIAGDSATPNDPNAPAATAAPAEGNGGMMQTKQEKMEAKREKMMGGDKTNESK